MTAGSGSRGIEALLRDALPAGLPEGPDAVAVLARRLAAAGIAVTDQAGLEVALSATCHHNDPGMGYARGECDEPWRHAHHAAAIIEALG